MHRLHCHLLLLRSCMWHTTSLTIFLLRDSRQIISIVKRTYHSGICGMLFFFFLFGEKADGTVPVAGHVVLVMFLAVSDAFCPLPYVSLQKFQHGRSNLRIFMSSPTVRPPEARGPSFFEALWGIAPKGSPWEYMLDMREAGYDVYQSISALLANTTSCSLLIASRPLRWKRRRPCRGASRCRCSRR
jgi:hypothetical protein